MNRIRLIGLVLAITFLVAASVRADAVSGVVWTEQASKLGEEVFTFKIWTVAGNTGSNNNGGNGVQFLSDDALVFTNRTFNNNLAGFGVDVTGFDLTGFTVAATAPAVEYGMNYLSSNWTSKNGPSTGTVGGQHFTNTPPYPEYPFLTYEFIGFDETWLSEGGYLDFIFLSSGVSNVNQEWTFTFFGSPTSTGGGGEEVPAPATLAIVGLGLAGLGLARTRRRK